MKEMYDIEEFIKLKVQDHVSEVSPHIWDNIQRKQSSPSKFFGFLRSHWRLSSVLIGLLGLLSLFLLQQYNSNWLATLESVPSDHQDVITNAVSPANENAMLAEDLLSNPNTDADTNSDKHASAHQKKYATSNEEASMYQKGYLTSNEYASAHQKKYAASNEEASMHQKGYLTSNEYALRTQKESTTFNQKINNSNGQFSSMENDLLASKQTYSTKRGNKNEGSATHGNLSLSDNEEGSYQNRLMELNQEWAGPGKSKNQRGKFIYPHGPSVKYFIPIPEFDYRNLSIDDLPKELEVIPIQENILQVRDRYTEKSQIEEEEMAEELLEARLGIKQLKTKEREKTKKEKEKKAPPKKPKKDKKPWLWLDIVASPNYIIKNLNTYFPDQRKYLVSRLSTEQSRFGYTLGFRTSFRLHDVSEIRTGILYSRITENFEYQRPSEIDPNTGEEITFDVIKNRNRYHFVDVPILIGYREDRKEFDFNVNFGALINLAFVQQGVILDVENQTNVVDINETSLGPVFRGGTGLALYGSIGYNYKFSDKVHLLVEPSLKYTVRPINNYEFPIRQRFHMFGITTGLRVNIGR